MVPVLVAEGDVLDVDEYEGLGANGSMFLPFFVRTNCSDTSYTANRTDVYTGSF